MLAKKNYKIDSDTLINYIDDHIAAGNGVVLNDPELDSYYNLGRYQALELLRKTIEAGDIEKWSKSSTLTP